VIARRPNLPYTAGPLCRPHMGKTEEYVCVTKACARFAIYEAIGDAVRVRVEVWGRKHGRTNKASGNLQVE
jgi:hypothetical protein